MNSVFEMAVALKRYNSGRIDAAHTASLLYGNLSGLDGVDTAKLRNLAQSVGCSLADSEFIGEDPKVREASVRLQRQLNDMISEKTCVISVPDHLDDLFRPELLIGHDPHPKYQLRKVPASGVIFLCANDAEDQLSDFRKFNDLHDLEEAVWG